MATALIEAIYRAVPCGLIAARHRARGISALACLVYTLVLALVAFGHQCERHSEPSAAAEAGHAQHLSHATSGEAGGAHECLACRWQRDSVSLALEIGSALSFERGTLSTPSASPSSAPSAPALSLASRGPPLA